MNNNVNIAIIGLGQVGGYLYKELLKNRLNINLLTGKKINSDALITNLKGICLGVLTADCAPVLIYDKNIKMISVIHAGWKGALGGILKEVIFYFKKKGSNFRNINAVIGPCISKKNYEVKSWTSFKKSI